MKIFGTKKEIGPDTVLQRKSDLLFNEIDGEVVMLNADNAEYYGINSVGSRIWNLLEKPITFKNLLNILLEEYEVSFDQCKVECLTFLSKLYYKKLLLLENSII